MSVITPKQIKTITALLTKKRFTLQEKLAFCKDKGSFTVKFSLGGRRYIITSDDTNDGLIVMKLYLIHEGFPLVTCLGLLLNTTGYFSCDITLTRTVPKEEGAELLKKAKVCKDLEPVFRKSGLVKTATTLLKVQIPFANAPENRPAAEIVSELGEGIFGE